MKSKKKTVETLKGVLCFYFEPGTKRGYWAFRDSRYLPKRISKYPRDIFTHEGLYFLKNGDKLTIFSDIEPETILWSGKINFKYYYPRVKMVHGILINSEQKGINIERWTRWFVNQYPAELIPLEVELE